jgi:ribulose-5-phosphate 4-epimerase/fuculose-1-phosphate aldolase
MVVAHGYVHDSLGNIAIRVPHPYFEHGVVYTKHAEISLDEMTLDNVVITDVPTPALPSADVTERLEQTERDK